MHMIKISSEVKLALEMLKKENGFKTWIDVDAFLGVGESASSAWVAGRTKHLQYATWVKVEPKIRQYLDKVSNNELNIGDDISAELPEMPVEMPVVTSNTPWNKINAVKDSIECIHKCSNDVVSAFDRFDAEDVELTMLELNDAINAYKSLKV